jgi:hypothetical protein
MLTDGQKTLLMMQANLDQIRAVICHGLDDPNCIGQDRGLVEEMQMLADAMQTEIERLRALHT